MSSLRSLVAPEEGEDVLQTHSHEALQEPMELLRFAGAGKSHSRGEALQERQLHSVAEVVHLQHVVLTRQARVPVAHEEPVMSPWFQGTSQEKTQEPVLLRQVNHLIKTMILKRKSLLEFDRSYKDTTSCYGTLCNTGRGNVCDQHLKRKGCVTPNTLLLPFKNYSPRLVPEDGPRFQ